MRRRLDLVGQSSALQDLTPVLSKISAISSRGIRHVPFQALPNDSVELFGVTEIIFFTEIELRRFFCPVNGIMGRLGKPRSFCCVLWDW